MSRYRGQPLGRHEDAGCIRARAAFVELRGVEAASRRAADIAALPSKVWRGRRGTRTPTRVYRLRCHGTRGRGPHDQYLPERVLWSLIDFRAHRCAHHLGD